MLDDLRFVRRVLRLWRQRKGTERLGGSAVDQKLQIDVVVGEPDEIGRSKDGIKLLGEKLGVFESNSKRDDGPGVSQDSRPEFLIKLPEVLVRQNQVQAVLSRSAQN